MNIKIISDFGENKFEVSDGGVRKIFGLAMELHGKVDAEKSDTVKDVVAVKPEEDHKEEPEKLDLSALKVSKKKSRVENLFGADWKNEVHHQEEKSESSEPEYMKGFIICKCEKCGKVKAYCIKENRCSGRCECGHETDFHDMKPVFLNCKCGKEFKYMTNLQTAEFTHKCIECGSEVKLKLNARKTAYTTIVGGAVVIVLIGNLPENTEG